jgi:MarR family
MKLSRDGATATGAREEGLSSSALALVITAAHPPWYQRLGPLAWTALQHLALNSHRTDQGRSAAVGVRDVAAGLGVTKDTAARAISQLVSTGLVTRERVEVPGGHQRSGYLLHLPDSMSLIDGHSHLHDRSPRLVSRGVMECSQEPSGGLPCDQPLSFSTAPGVRALMLAGPGRKTS